MSCDCKGTKPTVIGTPMHNRLDVKLESLEFTAPECGSINATTGKPEYCCFDCPTLKAAK